MKSQAITDKFTEANVEALAVAVFKDEKASSGVLKELDNLTGGLVASVFKAEEFKGEEGETALLRFAAKGKTPVKSMAGGPGFEPGLTESESAVLPLNYPPIRKTVGGLEG